MPVLEGFEVSDVPNDGAERLAVTARNQGFYIRHPPKPHLLTSPFTHEDDLFQTIHMGAVDVDKDKWMLVIDGLVRQPFALNWAQLMKLSSTSITSIHECFGSPIAPATSNVWRIGNVTWTGVKLETLLAMAKPDPSAKFVWSEGLDSGTFAGVESDRYQKDLPLDKAMCPEVLVAYEMNGQPLGRERGGPVRLVVPGWFGTNSTKWLCKLSLRQERAPGPYTTRFYNVKDPEDPSGTLVPVWKVDVNSMIVAPSPDELVKVRSTEIKGWSWSHDRVAKVEVSFDDGVSWEIARLEERVAFGWQGFLLRKNLCPGNYRIIARATSLSGQRQWSKGRRNHVHAVEFHVQ